MAKKVKSKANGEGTIVQRNGRYYGQVSIGRGPNGKLIRKTVYGNNYDECRKKLNELIHQRDKGGLPVNQEKVTVGQYVLHYYLNVKAYKSSPTDRKAGISNKTWNWYMDIANWYIVPELSDIQLSKFTTEKAQSFIDGHAERLSTGTLGGIKRTLYPALEYAITKQLMTVNPLKSVIIPENDSEDEKKALFVEKADLRYIKEKLDELKTDGLYIELRQILLTCIFTGMRISEVLGLRIKDIDLNNNTVSLRQQSATYKSRDSSGKVDSTTKGAGKLKTEDSKRDLIISGTWRKVLDERIEQLKGYGNPELLKPDAFVFCNRKGEMRTYSGTRSMFLRLMKRIGLNDKGYTLHNFRHSFISHSKAAGMDKDAVTRYVGHANSKITDRIYTHLTNEQKIEIAAGVDRAFEGF